MPLWIFLIFGMEVFLMVFCEKIIFYTLENSDMAKFWPFKTKIWPFFGQNWLFWEFFTHNFQAQIWIFLILGMDLLWILTLSGEPITLCLVVFQTFYSKWHVSIALVRNLIKLSWIIVVVLCLANSYFDQKLSFWKFHSISFGCSCMYL